MAARYEIRRQASGRYYFCLKAPNGKRILVGGMSPDAQTAMRGILSVRKHAGNQKAYDRLTSKAEELYFTLRAGSDEVIGRSEMYSSEEGRAKGIASVMKHAACTQVVEVDEA